MERVGTENLYLYLSARSKIFDGENKLGNESITQNELQSQKIETNIRNEECTLTNTKLWLHNSFSTYINNNSIECPVIVDEEKWLQNEPNRGNQNELRNVIYKLQKEINYFQYNNLLNAEIVLKGESKFWIFLRCEEKFNEKTVAIILSKKDFCKRCFVSLGSFVDKKIDNNKINIMINNSLKNKNNINNSNKNKILYINHSDLLNNNNSYRCKNIDNNFDYNNDNNDDYNNETISNNCNTINNNDGKIDYDFAILKTQELVEELTLEEKKKKYKNNPMNNNNNNICFLDINVFDDGNKINVKIKLNKGKYDNEISGNCFRSAFDTQNNTNISSSYKLPKYKIMIAGSGEGCSVLQFSNQMINKMQKIGYRNNKEVSCQCCIIN